MDKNEIANKYPNQITFCINQINEKAKAMQRTYHFAVSFNLYGEFFNKFHTMDDAPNRIDLGHGNIDSFFKLICNGWYSSISNCSVMDSIIDHRREILL